MRNPCALSLHTLNFLKLQELQELQDLQEFVQELQDSCNFKNGYRQHIAVSIKRRRLASFVSAEFGIFNKGFCVCDERSGFRVGVRGDIVICGIDAVFVSKLRKSPRCVGRKQSRHFPYVALCYEGRDEYGSPFARRRRKRRCEAGGFFNAGKKILRNLYRSRFVLSFQAA